MGVVRLTHAQIIKVKIVLKKTFSFWPGIKAITTKTITVTEINEHLLEQKAFGINFYGELSIFSAVFSNHSPSEFLIHHLHTITNTCNTARQKNYLITSNPTTNLKLGALF